MLISSMKRTLQHKGLGVSSQRWGRAQLFIGLDCLYHPVLRYGRVGPLLCGECMASPSAATDVCIGSLNGTECVDALDGYIHRSIDGTTKVEAQAIVSSTDCPWRPCAGRVAF